MLLQERVLAHYDALISYAEEQDPSSPSSPIKHERWDHDSSELCDWFYTMDDHCTGCPVYDLTGKPFCLGTPMRKVFNAIRKEKLWWEVLVWLKTSRAFIASLDFRDYTNEGADHVWPGW